MVAPAHHISLNNPPLHHHDLPFMCCHVDAQQRTTHARMPKTCLSSLETSK